MSSAQSKFGFFETIRLKMRENRRRVVEAKERKKAGLPPLPAEPAPAPVAAQAEAKEPFVLTSPTPGKAPAKQPAQKRKLPAATSEQPAEPSVSSQTEAINELKRYAFVRWLLRVLGVSAMLNVFVLLCLGMGWILAGQRPLMQLTAPTSMREEADAFFGKTEINYDDLLLFIHTTLPLLHQIDDRGAAAMPLLRGMISPSVFEVAAREAGRATQLAKKHYAVQNLVVTRVTDIIADSKRGRVSCYVRGYLAIIIQSSGKNVILPYRAQVLLEMIPPSRLNRFPFMLVKRDWRIDKEALAWDAERALKSNHVDDGSDPASAAADGTTTPVPQATK